MTPGGNRHLVAALAALALLTGAPAVMAQNAPAGPELDVVVETNLRETPKHRAAYLAAMLANARKCLGGLVAETAPDPATPPPDGAAPYRLFIQHHGKVEVDQTSSAAKGAAGAADGVGRLLARQRGTFLFRLAKWSGSAYPTEDQWTSEFATSHFLAIPPGASADNMVEYRNEALMLAMPHAMMSALLDHVLPIRVTETAGESGSAKTYRILVENRSRWSLRKLAVRVIWCEKAGQNRYRYRAEARYDGLLAPGKKVELAGTAALAPSEFVWEYELPTQIEAVPTFVPGSVPPGRPK